jgi:hypothetical protein
MSGLRQTQDAKTFAKTTKQWVDWFTQQHGYRVMVYSSKSTDLSPKQLLHQLKDPKNGLCLSDIPLDPKDEKAGYDLTPGPAFLDDLLNGDKWRYPDTEVIVAQNAERKGKAVGRRIIGVAIIHRYAPRAYEGEPSYHAPPDEKHSKVQWTSPEFFRDNTSTHALLTDHWYDLAALCVFKKTRRIGVARALLATVVARIGVKTKKGARVTGLLASIAYTELHNGQFQFSTSEKLFDEAGFDKVYAKGLNKGDEKKAMIPWRVVAETAPNFKGRYMLLERKRAQIERGFWPPYMLYKLMGRPKAVFCGRNPARNIFGLKRAGPGTKLAECAQGLGHVHYKINRDEDNDALEEDE